MPSLLCAHRPSSYITVSSWLHSIASEFLTTYTAHAVEVLAVCQFIPLMIRCWSRSCRDSSNHYNVFQSLYLHQLCQSTLTDEDPQIETSCDLLYILNPTPVVHYNTGPYTQWPRLQHRDSYIGTMQPAFSIYTCCESTEAMYMCVCSILVDDKCYLWLFLLLPGSWSVGWKTWGGRQGSLATTAAGKALQTPLIRIHSQPRRLHCLLCLFWYLILMLCMQRQTVQIHFFSSQVLQCQ